MRAHKSFVLAAVAIGTIADSATAQQPKPGATEPPKLAIVIAGDRAAIEQPLKALKLAPVEIRDLRGRRVITP